MRRNRVSPDPKLDLVETNPSQLLREIADELTECDYRLSPCLLIEQQSAQNEKVGQYLRSSTRLLRHLAKSLEGKTNGLRWG